VAEPGLRDRDVKVPAHFPRNGQNFLVGLTVARFVLA